MSQRTWARGIVTTYTYGFNDGQTGNEHGDLVGITYPNDTQGTQAITYSYDRRGRQSNVHQGSSSITSFTYNDAGQVLTESYSGAGSTLAGLTVTTTYDGYLRRSALSVNTATPVGVTYGYDAASRLQTVTGSGALAFSATYSYLDKSPLVGTIVLAAGSHNMTTTKAYDRLNRLTSISSVPWADAPASFGYSYNDANQRTRVALADGSYWRYEYDKLGQVRSGRKYWSDGTPVAGQQFEYSHDDIGNRTGTKAGGDENGANLRSATYSANRLNQYTSRIVPGAVDLMGVAQAVATVSFTAPDGLNTGTAPYRKGEYFRKELLLDNTNGVIWEQVGVTVGGTSVSGHVFLPRTPENLFDYDHDGNLIADGHWKYYWDGESRLIRMEPNTTVGPQQAIVFEYDWMGRRIGKTVTEAGTSTSLKFVFDGWNLIAVLNSDSSLHTSFAWGLDLSGSLRGAGGIGGLLALDDVANGLHLFTYDGNGNVVTLVKASDGGVAARYEYGPFGEVIRSTGPMAKANPVRFSTKYQDDETDLLYYGYRYYNASVGRWLSRDPIAEVGGLSLYGFVADCPTARYDPLGLSFEYKPTLDFVPNQPVIILPNGMVRWGWTTYLPVETPDPQKCPCGWKLQNYSLISPIKVYFAMSMDDAQLRFPLPSGRSLFDHEMAHANADRGADNFLLLPNELAYGKCLKGKCYGSWDYWRVRMKWLGESLRLLDNAEIDLQDGDAGAGKRIPGLLNKVMTYTGEVARASIQMGIDCWDSFF